MDEFEYTLESLTAIIPAIWRGIRTNKVIVLEGDLGAGKTTFVSYLCNHLNVYEAVSSPTFSIINEYTIIENSKQIPFYHIDLYRIAEFSEIINLGLEDLLMDKDAYFFIEWPQIAQAILPRNTILLSISTKDILTRTMHISPYFTQ